MCAYRQFPAIVLLATCGILPGAAFAQTLQTSLPLDVGQTVRVTSTDGKVTKGKITLLTPFSIILESPGKPSKDPASLAVADVRKIQLPDSVADGVAKGVLVGGLAGWLSGTVFDAGAAIGDAFGTGLGLLFGGKVEPISRSSAAKTGTLLGVFFGGAVGYAIDDGKMKTIYERGDDGLTVSVRPIASAAGKGVGVRVTW